MKVNLLVVFCAACVAVSSFAQGTFLYDQQSATESTGGGVSLNIQDYQPVGQSFIPTLDSIGFVRLQGGDATIGLGGATLYVNLRADSISGQVLAQTESIAFPDGFYGYMEFIFATPAPLIPGNTYVLQPVAQGNYWQIILYNNYFYPNGTVYLNGIANTSGFDLWFREGIIVPEPSAVALFVGGGVGLLWLKRRTSRD
jgi:hypothetical protein